MININTDAIVKFTNKLEKMHKSALPTAIRNTLNNAAYILKTYDMPESANKTFENRQKNFFKANSRYEKATGYNIKTMRSTVGFIEGGLTGGDNFAVRELEQQEEGGRIDKRTFVPLDDARQGNTKGGLIKKRNRLSSIRNIVEVKKLKVKNKRSRFAAAAAVAGRGGFVLSGKVLWRIDSFRKTKKNSVYTKSAVYSFKKGRSVSVKKTDFMKKASLNTAKELEHLFIIEAEKQFEKFL